MKKYYILLVAFALFSCGYRQEEEIRVNSITGKTEYVVWVWKDLRLLESFKIPVEKINKNRSDSLQRKADEFIIICKNVE